MMSIRRVSYLPLQSNPDEIGSFPWIHGSGKKDGGFEYPGFLRPSATAGLLHL